MPAYTYLQMSDNGVSVVDTFGHTHHTWELSDDPRVTREILAKARTVAAEVNSAINIDRSKAS